MVLDTVVSMEDDYNMRLYSVTFDFHDVLGAGLGEDPNDFVTEHHFKIHTVPEEPSEKEALVGRGKLSLIQFGLAMDAEFPLRDVMDASSTILAMSESLFSWEEDVHPFEKLDKYFENDPIFNADVCFVEQLEILPAFRGQGIGRAALISIARKFHNSCGLLVLKAFPLQHEARLPGKVDQWVKAMRYDELDQDLERSRLKLNSWYQEMGFTNPFDLEYFIARPEEYACLPMFVKYNSL